MQNVLVSNDTRGVCTVHRLFPKNRKEMERPEYSGTEKDLINMVKLISHDNRSSLVSMAAHLKLLVKGFYGEMEDSVNSELAKVLFTIERSIGMQNDFSTTAFLLNGDFDMPKKPLHLKREIIQPVLNDFPVESCGHFVVDEGPLSIPDKNMMISGNGFLLKAVFRNLLKNAVKYGAEGGIVSIGLRKHGCFLRINIHNHGRPVPKEYRDRLFNKFSTIPKHGKHNQDGMGLGLFLVKEIIHKEGGRIWYEATDHGSNFVFILPQNR